MLEYIIWKVQNTKPGGQYVFFTMCVRQSNDEPGPEQTNATYVMLPLFTKYTPHNNYGKHV